MSRFKLVIAALVLNASLYPNMSFADDISSTEIDAIVANSKGHVDDNIAYTRKQVRHAIDALNQQLGSAKKEMNENKNDRNLYFTLAAGVAVIAIGLLGINKKFETSSTNQLGGYLNTAVFAIPTITGLAVKAGVDNYQFRIAKDKVGELESAIAQLYSQLDKQ